MFCIQWKLLHIIAAFEMYKALFPLPNSFLSLRIVLMNWKGHDICEELKKMPPHPGLEGSSQHKGLWEPGLSSCGSPGMWLCLPFGWHVELILTAVLYFPNCFQLPSCQSLKASLLPRRKGTAIKEEKAKAWGRRETRACGSTRISVFTASASTSESWELPLACELLACACAGGALVTVPSILQAGQRKSRDIFSACSLSEQGQL